MCHFFDTLLITCSCLHGRARGAVAEAIKGFDGEVVNVTTLQVFKCAGSGTAATEQSFSIHGSGVADILHCSLCAVP